MDSCCTLDALPTYPWFSHLERAQQKLMWRLAGDAVVGRREELLADLESVPMQGHGTLTLDPDLPLPGWYTAYDIHIQPGSFHADDMSAYVYEMGARVIMLCDHDGYKFHRCSPRPRFLTSRAPPASSTSAAASARAPGRW